MIIGVEQEIYKANVKYPVMPESKKVFKRKMKTIKIHSDDSMSKKHSGQVKELPTTIDGENLSNKIMQYFIINHK